MSDETGVSRRGFNTGVATVILGTGLSMSSQSAGAEEEGEVYFTDFSEYAPEPTVSDYTNERNIVDTDNLQDAVDDWQSGQIETDMLTEVVNHWQSEEKVSNSG